MIEIVEYNPSHQQRFKEINVQWITRNHKLEEEDIKTLDNPEDHVLKGGGRIFIALYDNKVVGTCGYLNFGENNYEMIKMAVDEDYRGLNIGRVLGEFSMKKMKETGAKTLFLFSNTKGSPVAIELYKKLGFTETPLGNPEFLRADIRMEIRL
ncbi:MAG: GNAT family N-acetyltransferase [Bacteroidota bacterium]